jgi:glycosyltransferase involved in cell wall biosynthesis
VVSLTYNRKKFLDLAFHNLLSTDYPKDKIEWVIVDDSDDPDQQASDKIIKFGRENAPMSMAYIPLAKRTIGRKRNVGIFRAENPIILFMDDDDHYPPSSFRRRVSALLTHPWKPEAVVCTTIACYDLQHGISAVNTPPWSMGLSKRVSEATLTFYKSFWEVKNFPKVNMAEGDEFIEGREDSVLEIPPQQIIVAMSHGSNSTTRRFPTGGTPSCFWGFPKEFLVFLHGLVGVQVE